MKYNISDKYNETRKITRYWEDKENLSPDKEKGFERFACVQFSVKHDKNEGNYIVSLSTSRVNKRPEDVYSMREFQVFSDRYTVLQRITCTRFNQKNLEKIFNEKVESITEETIEAYMEHAKNLSSK